MPQNNLVDTKLINTVNLVQTWPLVYTMLYFDVSPVIFVSFILPLLCAHAAYDLFTVRMIWIINELRCWIYIISNFIVQNGFWNGLQFLPWPWYFINRFRFRICLTYFGLRVGIDGVGLLFKTWHDNYCPRVLPMVWTPSYFSSFSPIVWGWQWWGWPFSLAMYCTIPYIDAPLRNCSTLHRSPYFEWGTLGKWNSPP